MSAIAQRARFAERPIPSKHNHVLHGHGPYRGTLRPRSPGCRLATRSGHLVPAGTRAAPYRPDEQRRECRRRGWSRRRSGSRRAPSARPAADCWFPTIRAMSSSRIRWPPLSDTGSATAGGVAAALMLTTSELLATPGAPSSAPERWWASSALSAHCREERRGRRDARGGTKAGSALPLPDNGPPDRSGLSWVLRSTSRSQTETAARAMKQLLVHSRQDIVDLSPCRIAASTSFPVVSG